MCKKVCPIRNLSSLDGFFKAISDMVLEENGVVFGARSKEDKYYFLECHVRLVDYHSDEVIRYIQFRYKGQGWWQTGLRMQFLKEDYFFSNRSRLDPYMAAFLNEVNLNEACYHCKFKAKEKNADFSIGDAWNINRIRVNMDDDRGITIVLVNSEKGIKFIKKLEEKNHLYEISVEEAMFAREEWNPDKKIPDNRKIFLTDLKEKGFRYAYEHNVRKKK